MNKAQALAELAIFGSLILFVLGIFVEYGMRMNYQQNLWMQTSRDSRVQALGNDSRKGVSWIGLTAKPLPKADSRFGEPEGYQIFSAQSLVTSTNKLFQPLSYGDMDYLPRVDYTFYDKNYRSGSSTRHYEFTTAGYKEYACPASGKVKNLMSGWGSPADPAHSDPDIWYHNIASLVICKDVEEDNSYDVDEDGEEELVIKKENDGAIFKVIDYQEGEFDSGLKQKLEYTKEETKNLSLINSNISGPPVTNARSVDFKSESFYPIQLNGQKANAILQYTSGPVAGMEEADLRFVDHITEQMWPQDRLMAKVVIGKQFNTTTGEEHYIIDTVNCVKRKNGNLFSHKRRELRLDTGQKEQDQMTFYVYNRYRTNRTTIWSRNEE